MTRASMMAQDDPSLEDRIRERAYALWVEAGEQHGRADEFWFQAEQEILGSGVDQIDAGDPGGEGESSEEGADASLASDDGIATPAADKPKRTRKAPAKTKTAVEPAALDGIAEKPRRSRRPTAPA